MDNSVTFVPEMLVAGGGWPNMVMGFPSVGVPKMHRKSRSQRKLFSILHPIASSSKEGTVYTVETPTDRAGNWQSVGYYLNAGDFTARILPCDSASAARAGTP